MTNYLSLISIKKNSSKVVSPMTKSTNSKVRFYLIQTNICNQISPTKLNSSLLKPGKEYQSFDKNNKKNNNNNFVEIKKDEIIKDNECTIDQLQSRCCLIF